MTENSHSQSKYKIEGNIDFYKLLQENEEVDYDDNNKCLITHEPLNETAVTLECNHSFNYLPIYNYVVNSKKHFNNMERKSLKVSQIKCPYCRNIQNTLLPLPPAGLDAKIIHGVNKIEYSPIMIGKCSYGDGGCKSTSVYLAYHDNHTYCFSHRALMKKKWEKEEKTKHKCTHVLTRGINIGLPCGKTITKNQACGLCVKHAKQSNLTK
jgi:hypothetical protein